jgi:hypothetical protein
MPLNHDAHDYAERIRARLPRRLQELREAAGLLDKIDELINALRR